MKNATTVLSLFSFVLFADSAFTAQNDVNNNASPQGYFLTPPTADYSAPIAQDSSTPFAAPNAASAPQEGLFRGTQSTPVYAPISRPSGITPSAPSNSEGPTLQDQYWVPPEDTYSKKYFQSWMKNMETYDTPCDCPPVPDVAMNDCYCLYCHYRPCYYYTTECEYVPNYTYQKCCRYVPQYYKETRCQNESENYCVTRCRYVPEYYCETKCRYVQCWNEETCCCEQRPVFYQEQCCRQCPQYYEETCTRMVPRYYEETCCRYVPQYYYVCVCNYCPQYKYKRNCTYIPQYYYKHQGCCSNGGMVMENNQPGCN